MLCCPQEQHEPAMAADDSPVVTEAIGRISELPPGTYALINVLKSKICSGRRCSK